MVLNNAKHYLYTEERFDSNLIEKARGYLMLGDNPAVYFDFADSIVSMVDNRLAPFALRNRIQGSNEIKAIVGNLERFRSYLSSRILTLHRDNAKNILNVLRMPQGQDTRTKANIALNCKALSLTDGYWIKFDGTDDTWGSVNLYENKLDAALVDVALSGANYSVTSSIISPDLTTKGLFAKSWIRDGKDTFLLKTDRTDSKINTKAEIVSSEVLDCFNVEHVRYKEYRENGVFACICRNITDKNISLVDADDLMLFCDSISLPLEDFLRGVDDKQYRKMIVCDYILSNTDRHGQNYGVLMDNASGEIVGMAPMYDQNLSLIADITGKSDSIVCNMGRYSSLEDAALKNIEGSGLRLIGDLEGIAAWELEDAVAKAQDRCRQLGLLPKANLERVF